MRTLILLFIGALTLITTSPLTSAQQGGRERRRPPIFDDIEPGKMRQRIEDLRKLKLMDILSLEGEQVEKFFGTYNPLQKAVYEAKEAMDAASKALWEATERKAVAADLTPLTNDLLAKMKTLEQAVHARHDGVRKVLTPEQFARYLAFEARFRDELDRMILKRVRDRMRN
jgi:hypothetical protein